MKFHHTALSVRDIELMSAFYCNGLGFNQLSSFSWPKGSSIPDELLALDGTASKVKMLVSGDMHLELFEFSSPEQAGEADTKQPHHYGITHTAYMVDDIHKTRADLIKLGATFNSEPLDTGKWMAVYGRDPEGNIFELLQEPE